MRYWLWFFFAVFVCGAQCVVERVARSALLSGCLLAAGVFFAAAAWGEVGVMWFYILAIPAWAWVATMIIDDSPLD